MKSSEGRRERNAEKEPAVVVARAYDLVMWILPKVSTFPRAHKFTIGDRLAATALDLLMNLVEASFRPGRREELEAASVQTNRLRYLFRLSEYRHLISKDSYGHAGECWAGGRALMRHFGDSSDSSHCTPAEPVLQWIGTEPEQPRPRRVRHSPLPDRLYAAAFLRSAGGTGLGKESEA